MKTMTIPEFHAAIKEQAAGAREHVAFRCCMCGTIQSGATLIAAGAGATFDDVERFVGFSCVGRFTGAGTPKKGSPPGKGCNWTLGGLFRLHTLEVVDEEGTRHPRFELASAEEAQALARAVLT